MTIFACRRACIWLLTREKTYISCFCTQIYYNVLTLHVYRKLSPDGKISLFVGQRDFIDHLTHVDPIDGVIVLETEDLGEQRVFVQLVLTYRYGREEDEVMGLTFAKEIIVTSQQIYPKLDKGSGDSSENDEVTSLQERLMKKFVDKAYPFHMMLPKNAPASVTLQPVQEDIGRPCGVQWEVRAFVGETDSGPPHKRSCIRMGIRRQQFAHPKEKEGRQPVGTCAKEFLLSPGKVHLHVSLDRQVYYQGEAIDIKIEITNRSHKHVKKIKITVVQLCDVSLGVSGQLRHVIAAIETQEGCPVLPNAKLEKTFTITPNLEGNRDKRGLAIQSNYLPQEPCLASSTLFNNEDEYEVFGVVVSYNVRVKVWMGALAGEMSTEIPFTLMNPPPLAPPPPLIVPQLKVDDGSPSGISSKGESETPRLVVTEGQGPAFSDTEPDTENLNICMIRKSMDSIDLNDHNSSSPLSKSTSSNSS
ncbi:UNVERIFIED_CONTAM: hypothetical protein RMT77_012599 [Armadillidium vulgare]